MSNPERETLFDAYRQLAVRADELFARVRAQFPAEVVCSPGCSDCCHAVFDLSLVEAMALNRAFHARFGFGPERSAVLAEAGRADRLAVRLKRGYYRRVRQGEPEERIMQDAARARIRCPLLGEEENCLLYENRPITCRLYGVPVSVKGRGRVCGKSRFLAGTSYPTVALDAIQDRLADLSRRLADALGTRLRELHTVYIPVSMSLLARYDDAYLGTGRPPGE
jgi:Fe-S-cluster containining protein